MRPSKLKKKKKGYKGHFILTPNEADLRADQSNKNPVASRSHHRHPREDLGSEEVDSTKMSPSTNVWQHK